MCTMMVGVHGNVVELCEVSGVNANDLWLPITRKHWFCLFAKENEDLWLMLGRPKGQHVRNLLGEAIAIPPSISVNVGQSSYAQIRKVKSVQRPKEWRESRKQCNTWSRHECPFWWLKMMTEIFFHTSRHLSATLQPLWRCAMPLTLPL